MIIILFLLATMCLTLYYKKELLTRLSKRAYSLLRDISLVSLLTTSLFYFVTDIVKPIGTTKFTLSNGKQTIVFQGVIHKGTGKYYSQIHDDIKKKRSEGYQIVREGVNFEEFNGYKDIDICNINYDKNIIVQPSCLGNLSLNDHNFDLTMDEIKGYFASKNEEELISLFTSNMTEEVSDRYDNNDDINVSRALVILSMKSLIGNGKISENSIKYQELLIDVRDDKLAENVLMMHDENIYILYGLAHFHGFFERLKATDNSWKIIDKEFIY